MENPRFRSSKGKIFDFGLFNGKSPISENSQSLRNRVFSPKSKKSPNSEVFDISEKHLYPIKKLMICLNK